MSPVLCVVCLHAKHVLYACTCADSTSSCAAPFSLQGNIGCKPLVALMHYMQDSKTSLSVLQALLQPLLDVEQHMPAQTAVPTPNLTPAERSEALRRQLHDLHPAGQSAHCTNNGSTQGACQQQPQQCQPRVGHLLHTLQLAERSLMLMDREEGFRQVASGPLSLWYCHDTEAKCQMLRARVVLEESVAVSSQACPLVVCCSSRSEAESRPVGSTS